MVQWKCCPVLTNVPSVTGGTTVGRMERSMCPDPASRGTTARLGWTPPPQATIIRDSEVRIDTHSDTDVSGWIYLRWTSMTYFGDKV